VGSGVTRNYYVQAYRSGDPTGTKSDWGGPDSGTRAAAISNATAPTSVSATGGNSTATVNWSGATNAVKYRVWWSTSSTGNGVDPASSFDAETTSTSTTFTLSNGTTYYFWVSASNTNNVWTSYSSSPRGQATPSAPVVSAPATPTGVGLTGSGVVSWTASSGATSYEIEFFTAQSSSGLNAAGPYTVTGISSSPYQLTSPYASPNNWARVRVRARNSGGASAYSAWVPSATTYT
jgi:hypothetical protein